MRPGGLERFFDDLLPRYADIGEKPVLARRRRCFDVVCWNVSGAAARHVSPPQWSETTLGLGSSSGGCRRPEIKTLSRRPLALKRSAIAGALVAGLFSDLPSASSRAKRCRVYRIPRAPPDDRDSPLQRGSDLFARPNATVHYSVRPTGPLVLPPGRVPERVPPLAAPYSPSYRLALVKPEWSVGQNVVDPASIRRSPLCG